MQTLSRLFLLCAIIGPLAACRAAKLAMEKGFKGAQGLRAQRLISDFGLSDEVAAALAALLDRVEANDVSLSELFCKGALLRGLTPEQTKGSLRGDQYAFNRIDTLLNSCFSQKANGVDRVTCDWTSNIFAKDGTHIQAAGNTFWDFGRCEDNRLLLQQTGGSPNFAFSEPDGYRTSFRRENFTSLRANGTDVAQINLNAGRRTTAGPSPGGPSCKALQIDCSAEAECCSPSHCLPIGFGKCCNGPGDPCASPFDCCPLPTTSGCGPLLVCLP